ncbi:MAG: adenosylmethionine--8-amino-7-oxononanoate transaminase [Planctomycetes bacterium GWF2_50_10]|nr:MAG: adenosylmethionine--8-amino-7-oxononanoate transaminase [Planctomycetes bacterium GWF2_50_10]
MTDKTSYNLNNDKTYVWHPFTQMSSWLEEDQIIIDKGEGFFLIDTKRNRYIDGVSSLWCNVHGHCVREIDKAVRNQLEIIAHSTLLGLGQTRSIELARKLIKIAPSGLAKVFYSDSGATSVEIALKMAYQYWQNKGDRKKTKFIALENSYHGDTVGSVSLGGISLFHSIFKPLLFETLFAPSPHPYRFDGTPAQCRDRSLEHIETLLKKNAGKIAAIIVEPMVQGAAGIIVHPAGFLKAVRELATKYNVLLIADEVATGFARTGKMFACEHENVTPDILCLAKGLTAGYLPLAATLATQEIFNAFLGPVEEHKTFYHGHTYTGNALACAAAIASLELFERNKIIESLPPKIALIRKKLAEISKLKFIGNTRQCGLMAGIEIVKDKKTRASFDSAALIGAKVCRAMRPKNALLRPLGDVIVLMPAPAMDLPTLDILLDIVYDTLKTDLPGITKQAK